MTLLSSVSAPRVRHRKQRGHLLPFLLSVTIGTAAASSVGYLLWPTWTSRSLSEPPWLPVSIGKTLFNVPTEGVRLKVQQHSGPQQRIDLSFAYPSLEASAAGKRIGSEGVDWAPQAIDLIFLSIAAHNDSLAPEEHASTIYPRYLDTGNSRAHDGLIEYAFRDTTPYANEDLFVATSPHLVARCTRDTELPGMCLSESRLEGADLTFRFPRSWLAKWRNVATSMDRIVAKIYRP